MFCRKRFFFNNIKTCTADDAVLNCGSEIFGIHKSASGHIHGKLSFFIFAKVSLLNM